MSAGDPSLTEILAKATFRSTGIGTNLVISWRYADDLLTMRIEGSSSDALPDRLAQSTAGLFAHLRPRRAAIDLTAVQSLPSVVLAYIVYFQKTAEETQVPKVVLYGVSPRVSTLLKMIGMADFFAVVPKADDVAGWYSSQGH
jgi:anti-anti-sigma regulatory factor